MAKEKKLTQNYAGVIALLEEKVARELGMTPEEVKDLTIIITNGEVTFNLNKKEK